MQVHLRGRFLFFSEKPALQLLPAKACSVPHQLKLCPCELHEKTE